MSNTVLKSRSLTMPLGTGNGHGESHWSGPVCWDLAICALINAIVFQVCVHAFFVGPLLLAQFSAIPLTILLLAMWGSYRALPTWGRDVPALVAATALSFSAAMALAGRVTSEGGIGPLFLVGWVGTLSALLAVRFVRRVAADGQHDEEPLPVVIMGTPHAAQTVYSALAEEGQALRIAAIFADGLTALPIQAPQNLVVSDTQWAKSFAECCGIQCGIVAIPSECNAKSEELIEKAALIFENLFVAPQIAKYKAMKATVHRDGDSVEIHVGSCEAPSGDHLVKRMIDLTGALFLCLTTAPFLLLAALAIRLTSQGPILYRQLRIGKGNRLFAALKFRTMFVDAGDRLNHYLDGDPEMRAQWDSVHKLKNDPRVTTVGRFLRRFSLDELPQIWNVLAGDMSLIGPRPIVVSEIEKYGSDYAAYEAVRPGLTGLWQVSGRNDTTYQERVDYDAYYVRNWSPSLDVRILARTFRAVISGVGAY